MHFQTAERGSSGRALAACLWTADNNKKPLRRGSSSISCGKIKCLYTDGVIDHAKQALTAKYVKTSCHNFLQAAIEGCTLSDRNILNYVWGVVCAG